MAELSIDQADVKPSLINWLVIGLMAMTFFALAKYLVAKYPVPGLTEVVQSV